MPAKTDEHTARVRRFRSDLVALQPTELIRKHITTGVPVLLTEDHYFRLRSLIADEFDVHPNEVIVVGSFRTGFSIAPKKRYKQARPNSDLDVAIVSGDRFDNYWDSVFGYAAMDTAWKRSPEYKTFVRMLFEGWIDPRGLPSAAVRTSCSLE